MSYAYVGCRTTIERNARGKGLKVYKIDDFTNEWKEIQCLKTENNPSFQAFDIEKEYLYSVHGDNTKVSSYKIANSGELSYINTVDIGGKNPVFVTVDKTNNYLIIATLQGGKVFSLRRNDDGSIGEIVDSVVYEGKTEGTTSFVHQCIWDKSMQYIIAPAQGRVIGNGQVRVLKFDSCNGKFIETYKFLSREYAEPRHIAFHPNNKYAFMVNEKDNTITYFGFDEVTGTMEPRQIVTTLPETYVGAGQASAILVDPNGMILVASNRIHDSLVLYRINKETGYLTQIGFAKTLGKTPRFMTFSNDGSKLYVANEDSDNIVEMQLDSDNGIIEYTGNIIETESPVCIIFK